MGGCYSAVKKELKPTEFDKDTDTGCNSLELDSHVNPTKSKEHFDLVKGIIKNKIGYKLVCKGLTFIGDGYNNDAFCKVDIVVRDEKDIFGFLEVLNAIKDKISLTSVIIRGDVFKNQTNQGTKIGLAGFQALMEIFAKSHFQYVTEFQLNNFEFEPTPFLAFIDASLVNNPLI